MPYLVEYPGREQPSELLSDECVGDIVEGSKIGGLCTVEETPNGYLLTSNRTGLVTRFTRQD